MKAVEGYLSKGGYANGSALEISGSTAEWLKYFSKHTIAKYPEIDAHSLPYADNSFDAVFCNQVLEHVRKPWVCVKEFHRVLKDGGMVIISSPFIYQEHNWPEDNWRFTVDGLKILCEDFSKIALTHKGGNSKMLQHMIKNPDDRRSKEFNSLLNHEDQDKIYYVKSTIIAIK